MRYQRRNRIATHSVDVEVVLAKLGLKYERRENELYAKCPHPDHKDKSPSWHVRSLTGHEKNGVFHCWSCSWSGNLFHLVMQIKDCSFASAVRFLVGCRRELPETRFEVTSEDYDRNMMGVGPPLIDFVWAGKSFCPVPISSGSDCSRYLHDRIIGGPWITKFGLMDWREKRRVIIPIYHDRGMISWVARSYVGEKPKTLAPKHAPKKWELIGLNHIDYDLDSVSLAEGWADVIRLDQIFRPNPLGLCGSKISEYQAEVISRFKHVEIWMDGDVAGRVMAEDAAAWLGRNRQIDIFPMPFKRDPGDYSPEELLRFEAVPWKTYQREKEKR